MSSAVIAIIVRLAGLAGVKLSPFWAGAAVAGVLALIVGGVATAAAVHIFNAGYAKADGAWREKALEAQLAAVQADRDAARHAAADEALRAASIQQQAEQERAGTDAYVEELKTRGALEQGASPSRTAQNLGGACALSCDDLRGMRIKSGACAAGAGSAAGVAPAQSRPRPLRKTE